MAESSENRKLRYKLMKKRMAEDPEYAAKVREKQRLADLRCQAKKKQAEDQANKSKSGKPGRLVAMCGWLGF